MPWQPWQGEQEGTQPRCLQRDKVGKQRGSGCTGSAWQRRGGKTERTPGKGQAEEDQREAEAGPSALPLRLVQPTHGT